MKQVLVAMLVGLMAGGCYVQQPMMPPPAAAAPMPSYGDYQRGLQDGRAAGEAAPVVGYAVLGGILGLVVAPLCIVLIAAGGGSGGDCGNGGDGCFNGDSRAVNGPEGPTGNGDYQAGWHHGYDETAKPRRDHAEAVGFVVGLVIAIGVVAVFLSIPSNRDSLHSNSSAATNGGALPPPSGIAVRF